MNKWDYLGMDPLSEWMDENMAEWNTPSAVLPSDNASGTVGVATYGYAPSEGMFENDGVWDPVAKNWTVSGALQNAMEGVSWMGQAEQAMGAALAGVDRAMASNLASAIANGNAFMATTTSGATVVVTAGEAATSSFSWVAAGVSESYGSNIISATGRLVPVGATETTLRVYSTPAAFGIEGGHHVYAVDPSGENQPWGRHGSAQSSGTGGTNTTGRGAPDFSKIGTNGDADAGSITLPPGVTASAYFNALEQQGNTGLYIPWINDCHTSLIKTAEELGGKWKPSSNYQGRIGK